MAVPVVTCSADIEEYVSEDGVILKQLGATATGSPTSWQWTVLDRPPGTDISGVKGDFTDGVATVQNPQIEIDPAFDGAWCFQAVATNGEGPSEPLLDQDGGQQQIFVLTRMLNLWIPPDYGYNYGSRYLNPTIRRLESQALWEWNGKDLTQFLTKVDGDQVSFSVVSIASDGSPGNANWISIAVGSVGAGLDRARTMTLLPINISPIPEGYMIEADVAYGVFQLTEGGATLATRVGDGATPDLLSGYLWSHSRVSPYSCHMYRLSNSGGNPLTTEFNSIAPPTTNPQQTAGYHLEFGIERKTVLHERFGFKMVQYLDESAQALYAVGHPAIGMMGNTAAPAVTTVFFKRIRILPLPNYGQDPSGGGY